MSRGVIEARGHSALGTAAVVITLLVLLAAGGAATGFVRRQRRRTPGSPGTPAIALVTPHVEVEEAFRLLAMEAELQEIVAEDRARRVFAPASPAPPPSRDDARDLSVPA